MNEVLSDMGTKEKLCPLRGRLILCFTPDGSAEIN